MRSQRDRLDYEWPLPDSLTALAILALVGVPGFVYMQLRGSSDDPKDVSALDNNLATVFFGLVCAGGGVALSLWSQQERWVDVLVELQGGDSSETLTAALVSHAPEIGAVSVLGALFSAVAFAGLIRAARRVAEKRRTRLKDKGKSPSEGRTSSLLLTVGMGGLAFAGLSPWF